MLVGDAVGQFHPLTAVGMTIGFVDGECFSRSVSRGLRARACIPQPRARAARHCPV